MLEDEKIDAIRIFTECFQISKQIIRDEDIVQISELRTEKNICSEKGWILMRIFISKGRILILIAIFKNPQQCITCSRTNTDSPMNMWLLII